MKTQLFAAALGLLTAGAASAAQAPAGQFYKLNVSASFEAPFTDCWAFASNGKYITSFGGLGSFPYRLTNLNTDAGHYQAAWRGHLSIGFSGITNGSTLAGDGVDTLGRTYSYTGSAVSTCQGTPKAAAGHFFARD